MISLPERSASAVDTLTPKEIVAELDKYVVGQARAKRAVAIALRNRIRRQKLAGDLADDVAPKNILMIGPTGVGKTEIARRLARLAQSPFIKVEASKFTEVGYVSRDVESMVRDLVELSVDMVREEQLRRSRRAPSRRPRSGCWTCCCRRGRWRPTRTRPPPGTHSTPRASGCASSSAPDVSTIASWRSKCRNAAVRRSRSSGNLGGKRSASTSRTCCRASSRASRSASGSPCRGHAAWLRADEEQKLVDMDAVSGIAVRRVEQAGIIFVDEIDKVAGREGSHGPDVSREGVQRDILPIVEGTTVNTKHGMVRTDHILFIAAGAFHVSKPSDLIPELGAAFRFASSSRPWARPSSSGSSPSRGLAGGNASRSWPPRASI
ncbi:MAG: AAA family ATPase [Vicinamibacterales bacterium]